MHQIRQLAAIKFADIVGNTTLRFCQRALDRYDKDLSAFK
jgi:hypothetical protein